MDVEAPAAVIEKALGATINNYQVGEEVDFSNDSDPLIPARLSGVVSGVLGLNSLQRLRGLQQQRLRGHLRNSCHPGRQY